eukprot:1367408-Pyramimonas_sp.AAC.1
MITALPLHWYNMVLVGYCVILPLVQSQSSTTGARLLQYCSLRLLQRHRYSTTVLDYYNRARCGI